MSETDEFKKEESRKHTELFDNIRYLLPRYSPIIVMSVLLEVLVVSCITYDVDREKFIEAFDNLMSIFKNEQ